jgi:hypothetical protein
MYLEVQERTEDDLAQGDSDSGQIRDIFKKKQ